MQKVTEVPQVPTYVEGIINLHGTVIPMVDVRSHTVGLVIDAMTEVISVPTNSIEPAGNLSGGGMLDHKPAWHRQPLRKPNHPDQPR
jgi:purine-binding chemotaxis protein CheW